MDTITHGIAGALIGKAVFRGDDMLATRPMNRARIVTWSLMLGSIFPDSDVLRDLVSRNELLMITWHRSITHSLVCLPVWALLLAAVTRSFARWRNWEAPSFLMLALLYGAGILSHILLDLVTTFGTMIWSPLRWSRPAWDLIFIVDFTFTGILLVPQLLAWVNLHPDHAKRRAVILWLCFAPSPFLIAAIARLIGAPISQSAILVAILVFTLLFLLPAFRGWGHEIGHLAWNRAGLAAACAYLALAVFAHHTALARVRAFAALEKIDVQAFAALPLPPSLWRWDGLILSPRGVYEMRMDLGQRSSIPESARAAGAANASDLPPIEYHYFPSAPENPYLDAARRLPEVQKVLWFARFPVTRFHMEGDIAVVEILDMRFPQVRRDRPAAFTYRVRLDAQGSVLSQGWAGR
jgi:membrane-bound metal-dependent hydrolase YbcI (DUF457 family)